MILPRPTGCDMSTPPGTTPNKISTNLSFECKLCNKSYESPLLTKYHIHYEHGRNDPTVQNNIDKHMFIRQPEKDLFGDLLKQGDLKKTNLNSSVVISVENQAKELKTKESKAKESKVKESFCGVSRRKRSVRNKKEEKEKTTISKTSKKKAIKIKLNVTLKDATNHYTTINTTPLYEKTTLPVKTLNLEFDSSGNLAEKIKQKLIDAGISVQDRNTMGTTAIEGTTMDYEKFFASCQRSSSGQMEPGEFGEFMNKLKVLKTYGTLNVSKDQEEMAVRNYKFDAPVKESSSEETPSTDTNNNTQVENSLSATKNTMSSLANSSTISKDGKTKTKKSITTTQRIYSSRKPREKKTTHRCTCPTYSDYRGVWHNISLSSTEREFKMNEPNNMIQVRPRWYNESSEPQYPDCRSSSSEEITTTIGTTQTSTLISKAKSKRTRATSIVTVKHTRRKRNSTKNIGTIIKDLTTKKKAKKIVKGQTNAKTT
uniref:C2H2-type domain-containing protein n=1 Tax=Cacopsylla melanoneura TaxID=428564 RepID=A0A8D8QTM9_9HEMI